MERDKEYWISLWGRKGVKSDCPFCGHDRWIGWRQRVRVEQRVIVGESSKPLEVIPLTCSVCGFIRPLREDFQEVQVI